MGFLGALTLAFIVLKLIGIITWSWTLVLLPIIVLFALFFIVVAVMAYFTTEVTVTKQIKPKRKR